MMLKRVFVFSAILMVSLALAAQAGVVQGAHGQGAARTADNRVGEYDFEVQKATRGSETRLGGRLMFASSSLVNNQRVQVRINLRQLMALDTAGNVCEFGGTAVMLVRTAGGAHEIRGNIQVRVQDNRNREHPNGEPDKFRIHFQQHEGNLTYDFDGKTTRGDLSVFRRM
jgi:hypothetical protein